MILETKFFVPSDLLEQGLKEIPKINFKLSLNCPTGKFFYDPWEIRPEFKDTVWEKILLTLPKEIGEARLIKLKSGECYFGHGDIDDRYHLSLTGKKSYLVDLDNDKLYSLKNNGLWYTMDAGLRHSAVNFGDISRIQLVVRQLLPRSLIENITNVSIILNTSKKNYRYEFDNLLSPFLNQGCKNRFIDNFDVCENIVKFDIDSNFLENLYSVSNNLFDIKINDAH
jgi:hypothetical protein